MGEKETVGAARSKVQMVIRMDARQLFREFLINKSLLLANFSIIKPTQPTRPTDPPQGSIGSQSHIGGRIGE